MNKIQYDFVKCPACGNKIFLDDIDACHPNGIVWEEDEHGKKYLFSHSEENQVWVIHCKKCSTETQGDTLFEAVNKWKNQELYVAQMQNAIESLKPFFTSGNSIPVERATIRADMFWDIVNKCIPQDGKKTTH